MLNKIIHIWELYLHGMAHFKQACNALAANAKNGIFKLRTLNPRTNVQLTMKLIQVLIVPSGVNLFDSH